MLTPTTVMTTHTQVTTVVIEIQLRSLFMERPKTVSQTTRHERQRVPEPTITKEVNLTEKIQQLKENCRSSSFTKNRRGQSPGALCSTGLAHSSLVSQGNEHVHREDSTAPTKTGQVNITELTRGNTPSVQELETSSLSIIRTKIELYDISSTAKDVIMASWREGTKKQYCTYLTKWKQFCAKRNINWSNAKVEHGIDFLAQLFEQELSYSAINTARSALSVILTPQDGISFGENRLVCRFLKGVFEIKPALPKYKEIWDAGQVLIYLRSLTLNSELALKQLTQTLVMLLALLTGQRCQTIHKLNIQLMQKLPGKYIFTIGEKLKHTRPGTHQKPIELSSYADRDLCVVQHLDEYIHRTTSTRTDNSQLLISFIKPHNPVSKDTVARWIKEVLRDAGIDTSTYSAHSSRAAATSYGFAKGARLTEILEAAG